MLVLKYFALRDEHVGPIISIFCVGTIGVQEYRSVKNTCLP